MTAVPSGSAVPCPAEGCDGTLVPVQIKDEVEGYCGSCQKLYPWPATPDDGDGDHPEKPRTSPVSLAWWISSRTPTASPNS